MKMYFNDTLKIFTAKGEEELDVKEVIRSPESTRPLGLKNSDNKTIAAVTNYSIKFEIARDACSLQRGFLASRNFVNNIVELDAISRTYAFDPSLFFPLLAFRDFGSASPSLIHEWLFDVLRAIRFPDGAFDIIAALYFQITAFGRIAGSSSRALFMILSGIIQGCPLAGTCFALAMDPFLSMLQRQIEVQGLGINRACADDVGAAIRSAETLPVLASIFQEAEDLAGLSLNLKKTYFVPLNVKINEQTITTLRHWIHEHVPHWRDGQIVGYARYLGAFLGPKSANVSWQSPLAKWSIRASLLAGAGTPIKVATMLYNTRALTTLSYVAQFSALPDCDHPRERALLGRILHLPGNAMSVSNIFALSKWGSNEIRSVSGDVACDLDAVCPGDVVVLSFHVRALGRESN